MFARPEGAADCTAFDAGTLTWLLLVGMIPIWATIGAVCEFVRKRYQLARHGRSVAGQVRAALLSVEYDDLIEADTMAIPAVAAAVRKLRRLMIAAATLAGLLVAAWLVRAQGVLAVRPGADRRDEPGAAAAALLLFPPHGGLQLAAHAALPDPVRRVGVCADVAIAQRGECAHALVRGRAPVQRARGAGPLRRGQVRERGSVRRLRSARAAVQRRRPDRPLAERGPVHHHRAHAADAAAVHPHHRPVGQPPGVRAQGRSQASRDGVRHLCRRRGLLRACRCRDLLSEAPCRQPSAGGDRLCPRLLRGAASGGASRVLRGLLPRPA
mmetsp:Transcript_7090/g.21313  ORF Transcript_7090/g.21313 Transcript_7090/m.21313 type:complete len:326 (-) Transcript_7090:1769-2746(-)